MSDTTTKTQPQLLVDSSYTADLLEGTSSVAYSAYVQAVGFDQKALGPVEDFCGCAIDISTSMITGKASKKSNDPKFTLAKQGAEAFLDSLKQRYVDAGNVATTKFAFYLIGQAKGRGWPEVAGDDQLHRLANQDRSLPVDNTPENIEKARRWVKSLNATDGDTNLAPPMESFLRDASNVGRKVNILGMLTDGACSDQYYVDTQVTRVNEMTAKGNSVKVLNFGIGVEWNEAQLEKISKNTVSQPTQQISSKDDVTAAFIALAQEGASQALTGVRLMIKLASPTIKIVSVSVQKPDSIDLTDKVKRLPGDEQTAYVDLGTMNDEKRLIMVEFDGLAKPTSSDVATAGAVWLEYDYGRNQHGKSTPKLVRVTWTSDVSRSSVIARGVDEGKGFEGSKQRIREAVATARGAGGYEAAEAMLSEQYRIAKGKNPVDQDVIDILLQHVNVVDDAKGIVELKDKSEEGLRKLQAGSGSKVRVRGAAA